MNIFPIHTDEDLDKAFERVDQLWGASPGRCIGDLSPHIMRPYISL
ncbi:hypothetical protein LMG33818_000748 [Halomonadaceae bacterium LMG 33818]